MKVSAYSVWLKKKHHKGQSSSEAQKSKLHRHVRAGQVELDIPVFLSWEMPFAQEVIVKRAVHCIVPNMQSTAGTVRSQ